MFLLCLTGLLGITVTGDAFNAFVFLEISSLSTYVLIALGRDRRALLAAYQYLIMGTIGATFYVIGVGLLYLVTGQLNLADIAARLGGCRPSSAPDRAGLAFLTVGISLKLALFPLHVWLPNAYAYAPSFATVFLAATATKVAVYLLLRFFFSVFGVALDLAALPFSEVLLALSIVAMFVAVERSRCSRPISSACSPIRRSPRSATSHSASVSPTNGLTGGIIHLFNHAIMKAAVFLALGAVLFGLGTVQARRAWRASAARCRSPWAHSRSPGSASSVCPARPASSRNGILPSVPSRRARGRSSS